LSTYPIPISHFSVFLSALTLALSPLRGEGRIGAQRRRYKC
jgi:hypothetical protein